MSGGRGGVETGPAGGGVLGEGVEDSGLRAEDGGVGLAVGLVC